MIDEKLNWEQHIEHLINKLNMTIAMLKRIAKFIPKSEYRKLYDSFFKSHMNYCISSWGGVSESKLQTIFAVQKRCIRLLFGRKFSFDHAGYYVLNLSNLYVHQTFMSMFKVMKEHTPISVYNMFNLSQRNNLLVNLPSIHLTSIGAKELLFPASSSKSR